MARPLAFDRDRALRSATRLFWTRGYHATAMPALLEQMGIARSSLYASFGDKRHLFIECLDLFGQQTARLADAPPGAPATDIIWGFFHATLRQVPQEQLRKGCLLVNSTLELADSEPALRARASAQLECIERRFAQAFEAAEAAGTLKAPLDAVALARYVMTVNQGLRVRSRQGMPREALWEILTTSLGLIGLAPPQPQGDPSHAH
ncbi:TetR/AcrR family transcriptional regulator [Algiphilus sp.]|uniref:TetR/AcrR family transcriptional regulator n=1 Tax=Algiphilus sp. TaxID=1872431 RepID=UPI003B518423